MYNKELLKSEVEITNKIYTLNNKDEFATLLAETKEIKKIYVDLLKLFSLYSDGKDSLEIEKDLLEQINSLENNEEFNKASDEHPELEILRNNISLLYEAYGYKKELVDELKATEEKIKEEEKQKENEQNKGEKEELEEMNDADETQDNEDEETPNDKFFGELKKTYTDKETKEKQAIEEKETPAKKSTETEPNEKLALEYHKQRKELMNKLNAQILKKDFLDSVKTYRELKRLYLKKVFNEQEQAEFKNMLFKYYSILKKLKEEIEKKLGKQ
jgi:hypothetical protein